MIGRPVRNLLGLTAGIVVVSIGWSVVSHRAHAGDRADWIAVTDEIRARGAKIDSLEAMLGSMQDRVAAERGRLGSSSERIAHLERQAEDARLPGTAYREYRRTIDDHNATVDRVNEGTAALRSLWDEYSALVDVRNALIDSANVLQRRAVQEGYRLPDVEID